MNISVVIPNYEGAKLLSKNLPRIIDELQKYNAGKKEVIVVDDGSKDNSVEVVSRYPEVKLIRNVTNSGFSVAVNKGVKSAKGDVILLLNTDVYPEGNFLTPLLEHFKKEDTFAVGCMENSLEKNVRETRGRGVGIWKRGFLVHSRGETNKSDTLWVSGGSGIFRKSIWDLLGGLNEIYNPFYWEDIDLSYRAQKAGFRVYFEPKSVVNHEHEEGAIKKEFSPFFVKTIVFRNQFIFVWTNLTDKKLLIEHFLFLPYHFIKTLLNGDIAFYFGFIKALSKVGDVLKSRNKNKGKNKLSDQEVVARYR